MNPPLNETEKAWLKELLDRFSDSLTSAGCNDFIVTVTPEARETLREVLSGDLRESLPFLLGAKDGGPFRTYDFVILDHLRDRLGVL